MNSKLKAEELFKDGMKEMFIRSTPEELRAFKASNVWQDIVSLLGILVDNLRDEMETMGKATGYEVDEIVPCLSYFQGQTANMRTFAGLPDFLITQKMEEQNAGAE